MATSVLVGKATFKASEILEETKKEKGRKLETMEAVKLVAPVYIPSIVMGASTIACILGANVLNRHHQAALTSAYAFVDQSFKEYKAKVTELYGEEADQAVEEAIEQDHVSGENDLQLFYDEFSDRYFESTPYRVQRAEYELNRNMLKRDYAYLNEWYEELDLDIVENGYALGWSTFQCMEMYWQPWIDFDHYSFTTEDGRECMGLCIIQQPILDFEDYC